MRLTSCFCFEEMWALYELEPFPTLVWGWYDDDRIHADAP